MLYTECDGHTLIGPNDIVFDAHGGMWFTDHGRREGRVQHVGAIYYAQPDGSSIREVVFPSESPNGIGLSPDGTRLYAAETHTGRVYAWNVTGPGEVERNADGRGRRGDVRARRACSSSTRSVSTATATSWSRRSSPARSR